MYQLRSKRFLLTIILAIVLSLVLLYGGFLIGQNSENKNNDTITQEKAKKHDSEIKALQEEMQAVIEKRGIHIKSMTEKYKRENIGIYSPLFKGKEVVINTYKYNGQEIINKVIILDENVMISIWEYDVASKNVPNDLPGFAIFDGYENYALQGELVHEIMKNWKESYTTKNSVQMFYEYHYSPKTIGSVSLGSLQMYLFGFSPAIPRFIRIYNSKIQGFPKSANEATVLEAKKELQKVADTLEFGTADNMK